MALTKKQEALIREALAKVEVFCDPKNEQCAVPAEAREASRVYVSTWIAGPLEAALNGTEW